MTARFAALFGLVFFGSSLFVARPRAQGRDTAADFKKIVEGLSAARLSGADESQADMERAFAYLDSVAVSSLNRSPAPDLEDANHRLADLLSHEPPVGENYRLLRLGGAPAAYAMVINFGLGGPAAVRIYAGIAGRYAFAARIDRLVQKDFLDSDLELLPVSRSEAVFVTVAGRTDDLSTGMFSAWRFDGQHAISLWNSDLLQQSNYEADDNGFHLVYCSQVDEDHPSECLKMSRDLYRFQGGDWKRVETAEFPPDKPPAK